MALTRRLQVTYSGGTFTLPYSQRPWEYTSEQVGGGDISAGRVPVVYEVRRDRGAVLRPRFTEADWPDVRAWLEACQGGAESCTVRLDAGDAGTEHTVYVIRPGADERIPRPLRGDYPGELETEVAVITTDGSAIDDPVYG